tara:strand:+ start:2367 stop:2894 length:528 start_codon:yes stop_codon:yes gene_type:complete
MRRKETSLLVESWRSFINEIYSYDNTESDKRWREENKGDINALDSETMLKFPSDLAEELLKQYSIDLTKAKKEMKSEDGKYRIDFIIFQLLHAHVSRTQKNQILKYASAYTPEDILLKMINFVGFKVGKGNEPASFKNYLLNNVYNKFGEGEKLKAEFEKYFSLMESFYEYKQSN